MTNTQQGVTGKMLYNARITNWLEFLNVMKEFNMELRLDLHKQAFNLNEGLNIVLPTKEVVSFKVTPENKGTIIPFRCSNNHLTWTKVMDNGEIVDTFFCEKCDELGLIGKSTRVTNKERYEHPTRFWIKPSDKYIEGSIGYHQYYLASGGLILVSKAEYEELR